MCIMTYYSDYRNQKYPAEDNSRPHIAYDILFESTTIKWKICCGVLKSTKYGAITIPEIFQTGNDNCGISEPE